MKKFELVKSSIEIDYRNREEIVEGCTMSENYEIVKSFSTSENALEELKKYKSDVTELSGGAGTYYLVTEYSVRESHYDDGELIESPNICEFSEFPQIF